MTLRHQLRHTFLSPMSGKVMSFSDISGKMILLSIEVQAYIYTIVRLLRCCQTYRPGDQLTINTKNWFRGGYVIFANRKICEN